ncbi:MAG: amidohydrolase family protein [Gammaproteobacteria bacterium]|nr:amidohydrolase family protein [Gammaproteobacteria bacterium]
MAHDLVIRDGVIVDGLGNEPFRGDVAIDGDKISEIGKVPSRGTKEINADDNLVTPGFVDIHTHLDAQFGWDPLGTSSCYHGITSVVLGNCGVTFAPCKPKDREYLAELMESVEDIPRESILEGLTWDWETYGEYLEALDRLPKGINVGGMVGHCAVRYAAMGERSLDETPAGGDDIERMCELVDEAISSGALGFSTSRTFLHRVPDGRPVPGTYAQPEELLAIGRVLGKYQRGVFEAAARLGERDAPDLPNTRKEVAWMGELSRENGINVTFGLAHSERRETLYQSVVEFASEENAKGARLRPQTTSRPIGSLYSLHNRTMFDRSEPWRDLKNKNFGARLEAMRDAYTRERLVESVDFEQIDLDFDRLYVLTPNRVRYDMQPKDSLGHIARERQESVVEAFINLNLETNGRVVFYYAFLNQRLDPIEYMMNQPVVAMGLADSGAHVGQIMDASQPTWLLSYWVRERQMLTIEDAIRRWTSDTANLFGIKNRGRLEVGACADLNVIDLENLGMDVPTYQYDFPGGAGRYVQRAQGFKYTIVNGKHFLTDGVHTGELAGVTLRS